VIKREERSVPVNKTHADKPVSFPGWKGQLGIGLEEPKTETFVNVAAIYLKIRAENQAEQLF
jgi:hypothetical protein